MVQTSAFLFSCSHEKIKIASTIPFLIQIKSDWRCAWLFQGTCKTTSITATPTFVKLQHLSKIVLSTSSQLREQNWFVHFSYWRTATLTLGAFFQPPNLIPAYSGYFFKPSEGKILKNNLPIYRVLCRKKKNTINKADIQCCFMILQPNSF